MMSPASTLRVTKMVATPAQIRRVSFSHPVLRRWRTFELPFRVPEIVNKVPRFHKKGSSGKRLTSQHSTSSSRYLWADRT